MRTTSLSAHDLWLLANYEVRLVPWKDVVGADLRRRCSFGGNGMVKMMRMTRAENDAVVCAAVPESRHNPDHKTTTSWFHLGALLAWR